MELLGEARSNRRKTQRWSEARVYRTIDGYLLEKTARSRVPGERDIVHRYQAESAAELVRQSFIDQKDSESGQTLRLIPNFVRKALDAAAERDPAVAAAVQTEAS